MKQHQNMRVIDLRHPFRICEKPLPARQLACVAACVRSVPAADFRFRWDPKQATRLAIGFPRRSILGVLATEEQADDYLIGDREENGNKPGNQKHI